MELFESGKLVYEYLDKYSNYIFKGLIQDKSLKLTRNDKYVLSRIKDINYIVIYYFDKVFNLPIDDDIKMALSDDLNNYKEYAKYQFEPISLFFKDFNINVTIEGTKLCYSLAFRKGKISFVVDINDLITHNKINGEWYSIVNNNIEVLRGSNIFSFNMDSVMAGKYNDGHMEKAKTVDPVLYFLEKVKKENRDLIYENHFSK